MIGAAWDETAGDPQACFARLREIHEVTERLAARLDTPPARPLPDGGHIDWDGPDSHDWAPTTPPEEHAA